MLFLEQCTIPQTLSEIYLFANHVISINSKNVGPEVCWTGKRTQVERISNVQLWSPTHNGYWNVYNSIRNQATFPTSVFV